MTVTSAPTFGEPAGNTPSLVYNPEDLLGGEAVKWVKAIDGWTEHMRAANRSPLTIKLRREQIGALAAAHLRRLPWAIRHDDLIGWTQGQDWSPETRKSYRAALRSFYGWAHKAGKVKRNPAADLPPVRVPRGQPRPAPEAVLVAALEAASDRDRLILLLAAKAGLRRAEIAGLRWDHIVDGRMRITGKGGHVRRVPVHPILKDELAQEAALRAVGQFGTGWRYTSRPDSPYVFPGRNGKWATAESIGRAAGRALGPDYTGHTLRHLFATTAYKNSHNLLGVQKLLGHASPKTTTVYAEADDDAIRAIVDAL